jgi:zinc protease
MNKLIATLSVATLLVACGQSADTPQPEAPAEAAAKAGKIFDIPYLERDLDNGLRVVIVPTDYPNIVTIQIPVQTGSRNEVEAGKTGFAHFFEHMMFRGTEKYPADVYADILKKAGADQNAYTSSDLTNYHITFTKEDLEKVIEIEADRFQNLSYSEDVFRTEALAVKGEYLKNFSNPFSKMYERLSDLMFSKHTYKHTTMGFIEDIEAMPDQLEYSKIFFDRWYRPEKTTVILVGDLDAEATFALVKKYWGDWERGDYEIDVPVEPPLGGPKYEHLQWEGPTQPWFVLAFRGPAYVPTEKDMPALDLISQIYFSESSDLYRQLVLEDQSVDQLFPWFPDRKDPGLLVIAARLTDASHATDVRDKIYRTLAEARTQIVPEEKVEETKSRLRYSFTAGMDSSGNIGSILASFAHFDRNIEYINDVYATYDSLTAEDIRTVANKYFIDASRVTLSLSSDESMAGIDGNASLGELVAATGMADAAAASVVDEVEVELPASDIAPGDMAEVAFVAQRSDSSPLVDVSFLLHVGAAYDPDGKKGLSSLTAAMITEGGSQAKTIDEINAAMYPMAAGFGAQVDKEMTRLAGQVHKDNLDAWYALVRGQLLFPAWSENDFSRIKTQMKNVIRTNLVGNNDEELGKEFLYTRVYGPQHPFGALNLGATSDLDAITLDDVKAFYYQHYTVANMTVGLSGGYPDSFPALVSRDLQLLGAGEKSALEIPPAPVIEGRHAAIIEKETPGVAVSFGFPIDLRRGDPDWVALWLVRSYLGEHRSTNSYLFQRIRETRGMNYGDYAYIEYFPRGMNQFHPDTNLARQQQIFQVWIRPVRSNNDAHFATRVATYELDKLVENGMTESDFEATRAFLTKFASLLTDGQSRQLGYAIDSQYYGIDDFADYVRNGLSKLTLDDVNRVLRENLDMTNMQYVFVTRDGDDLRERLLSDQQSPMTYDAELPQAVLEEDKLIDNIPIGFDSVEVISADDVFN